MATKQKSPKGRPKKTTKAKSGSEAPSTEALSPEELVLQITRPEAEDESPVQEMDLNTRLARVDLLLSKQADEISVMSKERDELKAKVTSLTLRVSALLREKEQLQLELNAARKNEN